MNTGPAVKRRPFRGLFIVLNCLLLSVLLFSYLAGSVSPATFWPLAFIGMAYPVILFGTWLFALYWLLHRHWLLFLNIALILVKWDYVQETVQFRKQSELPAENGIKVMSFNVRLFDRFNWIEGDETEQSIYRFIAEQKPDILCIQEYHGFRKGTTDVGSGILDPGLTKNFHLEINPKKTQWKKSNGVATFSRFPIINKGAVFHSQRNNNMAGFTDVLMENDTVRIYNLHLQSIGLTDKDYAVIDEIIQNQEVKNSQGGLDLIRFMTDGFIRRAEQADAVAQHIQGCSHPVIVCGDFNDVPTSYAYQTIANGLRNSFSEKGSGFGATYIRVPFFRIDNILFTGHFSAVDHTVYQEVLSDHLAISAILTQTEPDAP